MFCFLRRRKPTCHAARHEVWVCGRRGHGDMSVTYRREARLLLAFRVLVTLGEETDSQA